MTKDYPEHDPHGDECPRDCRSLTHLDDDLHVWGGSFRFMGTQGEYRVHPADVAITPRGKETG